MPLGGLHNMFKAKREEANHPFCSAVILAAGSSKRMGEDKLAMELGGLTVLERSLLAFEASPLIDEIILVTKSEYVAFANRLGIKKLRCAVRGGDFRAASSWAGVSACSPRAELIAIHDAARPLVTAEVIERAVRAAAERGAAAPAVTVKDTVRQARGGRVIKTLERSELYLMQTPQVFRAEIIRPALEDAARLGVELTDDCAAVMLMDAEVFLVEGSEENIKLTTRADYYTALSILEARGEL